jgi:hypothetical protein
VLPRRLSSSTPRGYAGGVCRNHGGQEEDIVVVLSLVIAVIVLTLGTQYYLDNMKRYEREPVRIDDSSH